MSRSRQSLSAIERSYANRGYRGARLRQALGRDGGYQKLLAGRRRRLAKQLSVTPSERKRYVLSTEEDLRILASCKRLERLKLTVEERAVVRLIKTQLGHDWRTPLMRVLLKMAKRHKMKARND